SRDLASRELASTLTTFNSAANLFVGFGISGIWRNTMDNLTYTLRQLCDRNRDGSHATQGDRESCLKLMARQLKEAGFRQMKATSLNGKHVDVLLERWRNDGLSAGTLKNRLAHLRWWAEKVGKEGLIASSNVQLGVPKRVFVTNENKAAELADKLDKVSDPYARVS